MNDYNVQFMMDYFVVSTVISADDEEQAERLAEAWLSENGLDINKFKVLDVTVEHEGSFAA
jgi:ABC-type sugar transport system substrate-binding protein